MSARPDHDPPESERAGARAPLESEQRSTIASGGQRVETLPPSGPVSPGHMLDADRYSERETIGQGGSSIVIRALDNDILRDVAIKILNPEIGIDSQLAERFAQEARITGQLEHPSIVPVYELGVDHLGRRFLCTKLVEGKNLEDTLQDRGEARLDPVRLAELLQVFVKVCDAVSFAHSRGVIHRDLKPKNIMVSDFGQVYVVDWGTALVLRRDGNEGPRVRVSAEADYSELEPPGLFVGTGGYAPPEQMRGQHALANVQTDVFALGATLYEILSGRRPLTSEIRSASITPPEKLVPGGRVPADLSRIAMRALSHEPAERYQTVVDLKRDIESFQRGAWDLPRIVRPAGSILITEGEPGDAAYVILEGRCKAYRVENGVEVELRVMGPGEVFGETAVFSQKPRSASIKAQTDVTLVEVTAEALSRALGLHSWMGAFVRALADRFRDADQQLRIHGRGPPG